LDGLNLEDFFPVAWKGFQRNGKVWGLPERLDTESVVFYNKAMLDEAGLKYPTADWTYQDLLAYAQKLTKPPRYGLCIAGALTNPINISTQLLPSMRARGGDVMDPTFTKVTINQRPAVDAVQWWVDLYTKHKVVPPGTLNNNFVDCASLFGAEQVAMFISGPGGYNYLEVTAGKKELKIGTVPQPEHQARISIVGLVMPVGAGQPEEARRFAKWFINNLGELTIRTPATKKAYQYPPWNTPKMASFIEALGWGKPTPPIPEWTEMELIMSKEFQSALLQTKTVPKAMEDAAAGMQRLLKK
jgi:multiple sugar transport system substrate-binding protein